MIDLAPHHLETVQRILAAHVPDCEVRAFGSRAKWEGQDYSDLDLAVVCENAANGCAIERLKEALENSDLPIRVDVLDWHTIAEDFRQAIESDCVVLQQAPAPISWQTVPLGSCTVINDLTYSPIEAWTYISYLDTGSITENRIDSLQHLVAGRDKIPARARRRVRSGDIVYSTVRPNQRHYGLLKSVPEDLLVSTGFAVIRGKIDMADTDFIYWFLSQDHIIEHLHSVAEHSTSAYPSIRPDDLASLEVSLPPIEEQRAIAGVLGALDDRIELNRRMSETLEKMARALFRSWFVNFDPVRAKAEGRPSGLPPDFDALFPAAFEESELGEIPAGWSVRHLGDLVATVRGRSYRSSELAESDTALVTLKSFARGGGYRPDGLKPYVGEYKLEQVVKPGELVIACTDVTQNADVVGRPAIVADDRRFATLVASLDTLIVRPFDATINSVPFYYYLTSMPTFTQYTYAHCSGTTVLHLGKDDVPAFRFPAPPQDLVHAFATLAGPTHNRMVDSSTESATLSAQRDDFLPRLLSGKLRVDGVKRS